MGGKGGFKTDSSLSEGALGQMLCVRHTMYGPATLTLRGCRNTTLRNLNFRAVPEVLSFCGADLKFRSIHGVPQPGMLALNTAFLPSSRITECTVRRSRGKGILLQSGNAEIDHCSFTDLTHPAVRVAPAFIKWFEVGPCENLDLHDNRIENCCITNPDAAAITVSTSHSANDSAVHGLHKNIRIRNNIFEQMQKCIFVSSADGVQIQNNTLPSPNGIETVSCTDLLIE